MRFISFVIAAALLLNLSACGDKAENQAAVQSQSETQASDPRYQNPLLNINPQQFSQILADCGKLLFGEHTPPEEVIAKCKVDIKSRAAELSVTLSDENIGEPLVRERYNFTQRNNK
jgi:hypothetical protein